MEDELVFKIKNILKKKDLEECDIVCLIVKIRKLLPKSNINNSYDTLKSYCDWALHDEITYNKTCQAILGAVEAQYKAKKFYDPSFGINFYGLHEFKKELGSFLNQYGIQYDIYDKKIWINFRKLFLDNLTDCPIEPLDKNSLIEKFVFKTMSADGSINFEVKFRDNSITFNGSLLESYYNLTEGEK